MSETPDIAVVGSITAVDPAEWDAVFPGDPERWAYLNAVEKARLEGFELFYVTVRREGRLVAAAPGFLTAYEIDTTVQGPARIITRAVARALPFLMRLKLACLGSPVTETAALGVHPDCAGEAQALVAALFGGLAQMARARGVRLTAVKDIPRNAETTTSAAMTAGLNPMSSLPTAVLDLTGIASDEAYWSTLSKATRKDMRRKLRDAGDVTAERVRDLAPHAADVDALYAATRARADMQFEVLDWHYFQRVLEALGEDAVVFLYRSGGAVIAFNLLVRRGGVLVDKYFCTDGRGPEHNLYFVSWFNNVRFALESGVTRLVAGQGVYEPKLRLGCSLEPTAIWFRHGLAPVNAVLALLSRHLGVEETDPTLKERPQKVRGEQPGTRPQTESGLKAAA